MPTAPKTPRLDLADPLLFSFRAKVVGHDRWQGRPSVLLDRTAFYPESGGQLADQGRLDALTVTDVQLDEVGRVHHVVEGPELPALGAEVEGQLDRRRRRLHMALHTGQHMLSKALLEVAGARTASSRLGETACTVDVRQPELAAEQLRAAEELVNDAIEADLEVRTFYPSPEELARLPLRRRPKVASGVRVVEVVGFDLVPCGGTHCPRTSQVGLLAILGAERYKGMTRVTFAAGRRARLALREHFDALGRLGRELTCSPLTVELALGKLRRELEERGAALAGARARLAELEAAALLDRSTSPVLTGTFPGAEVELLRAIGRALIEARPAAAALLAAPGADGVAVFAARGAASPFDCGAFLREAVRATGGRGGGRPDHAEGRLPAGVDWGALVAGWRPGA